MSTTTVIARGCEWCENCLYGHYGDTPENDANRLGDIVKSSFERIASKRLGYSVSWLSSTSEVWGDFPDMDTARDFHCLPGSHGDDSLNKLRIELSDYVWDLFCNGYDFDEIEKCVEIANASLIAAAPDLLEALKKLLKISESQLCQSATHIGLVNCDAIADAKNAIAKAESEE